jgi:hypothetical protein
MVVTCSTSRPWTDGELTVLELCATSGLPALVIALKLGRDVDSVRGMAAETGVRLIGEPQPGRKR